MGLLRAVARALLALVVTVLATGSGLAASARATDEAISRSMVNHERHDHGLSKLALDDIAARIAERHSERMSSAGEVYHNDRLGQETTAAGLDWDVIGENVGVGASVEHVQRSFMASRSHRHAILDSRYKLLGVGVARSADDHVYVTQVFVRPHVSPIEPAPERTGEAARSPTGCGSRRVAEDGTAVTASFYGERCS